ncbi:MAG: hypothetical protein KKI02_09350 [Planctomycetes bacterium]|nr:hypothetical protein [Planctomycetota bacterium]
MRATLLLATALTGMGVIVTAGCGQTYFPDALDATLEQVDLIRNSDTLEPQEMRDELAEYGIDPVTINGLLSGVRLANQFGGDLSSAYNKVVNGQLTEMTPDEVQFYGDATDQVTYDHAEAQATVDLFRNNDIDSVAELEEWLDQPANELPLGVDEENLRSVFIDTDTDDVRDEL